MSQLPTGTVTLLFTDIEGSTLLLQQLGERYASVLIEYRDLLRTAFSEHHGYEVDTQGDGFFVVFVRASEALLATVAAQRALTTHSWPEGVVMRVRMGVHTGEPPLVGEVYVGLDVHYAARIMQSAHGGQVLLSQTTHDLIEHDLPFGVSLRDMGKHRLKDVQRPVHLYQPVIAGLPADFPPLKTLDSRLNNLPVQLTPLIGREKEVAAVQNLLQREEVRLVTLTGPGGTGKTRLGLQVAAELNDLFADGVYFVNLAPLGEPTLVLSIIAQTLGIHEVAGQSLPERLKEVVHQQQLLLVLDNFEQVVSAALQVTDLLGACPRLKLLVTSREVLHVRAEHEFAVPPLAVPDPIHLPELAQLSQCAAVALFIQRAQAVQPAFQLTPANVQAISEICVRLDGLPLAIELAAARIKLFPPQALLVRLEQRMQILTSVARDAPVRQQSLRNTIAWSYDLLQSSEEQRLFRWLSVFVGGCTLEAIEAVCTVVDTGAVSMLVGVSSLLDKSLLLQVEHEGEEPRLMMLEIIRHYALELLVASGEMEVTRHAHATYYLALAEKAQLEFDSLQQAMWFERLEQEHDNLRVIQQWLLEQGEAGLNREMALRLGVALQRFWEVRGHWSEGRSFLDKALEGSAGVVAPLRAKVLRAAANLALGLGDHDRVEALCEESLALCRESGDNQGAAYSLFLSGELAWASSNYAAARSLLEECLAFWSEVGERYGIAWSLLSLADVASEQGEYTRGVALYEQSLALHRELGNKRGVAWSLYGLAQVFFVSQSDPATIHSLLGESLTLFRELGHKEGMVHALGLVSQVFLQEGDAVTARSLLEESLVISREIGIRWSTAQSLCVLARAVASEGDNTAAQVLYEESLAIARKVGNKLLIASCLEGLAGVVATQGEAVWAARLWGAVVSLRNAMGAPLPAVYRADYERSVAAVRTQLGKKSFDAAWAEGRSITPEQALSLQKLATMPISDGPSSQVKLPTTNPDGLSARELEVLRLLATGLTNGQIAEQLVLSLHTIHAHLRTIYSKLGVTSRSAATRYAFEHQLV